MNVCSTNMNAHPQSHRAIDSDCALISTVREDDDLMTTDNNGIQSAWGCAVFFFLSSICSHTEIHLFNGLFISIYSSVIIECVIMFINSAAADVLVFACIVLC